MRLETWLECKQMSIDEFAKIIDKDGSLIFRYIHYNVIPQHDTIVKIYRVTLGAVTANDFHQLSDKIFEKKEVLHINSFRY